MKKETPAQELLRLRRENLAFRTHSKLLETFVTLVRSHSHFGLLRKVLQKTVDIAGELTGAERGSLLLLNEKGIVTDFFLTRKSGSKKDASRIIGTVMDKGLAGWVLTHRQVGLIVDTLADERWINLPDQPYQARSVIGVPIRKGEAVFGILTLMHSDSGMFDQETVNIIVVVASQLAVFLENAQLYAELDSAYTSLSEANEQIESYSNALNEELMRGRKIQQNFLPVQIPQFSDWQFSTRFHPAKQMSGDFYDIFSLPQRHICLVIADICDKGVGAALFMGLFRSLIRICVTQAIQDLATLSSEIPDEKCDMRSFDMLPLKEAMKAVDFTNRYIETHHGREGIFATMFFGILNTETGSMHYINAGHEPLFLLNPSGDFEMIPPTGPAVGIMPNSRFRVETITLLPGQTLFGYTDGVTDASSAKGERYGRERLAASLCKAAAIQDDLLQHVENDIYGHMAGSELADDIAMIAVHRLTI
jgi:sigma-B regulation protein RsbU (phosphoserine phosphatase)